MRHGPRASVLIAILPLMGGRQRFFPPRSQENAPSLLLGAGSPRCGAESPGPALPRLLVAAKGQVTFFFFFFLNFIYLFIYGCVGLRCREWAFSSCGERGLLFLAVRGLLIAVASLVVEHRL